MKKIILLTNLFLLLSGISGFAEKILLFDFENNKTLGNSWDCDEKIISNPSPDNVNASKNCLQATFTQTWGKAAYFQNIDYSKYALSFTVYTESLGDIWVTAYDPTNDVNHDLSRSVFAGNRWTRLYFDFSEITANANSIQIWTKSTNTILLDSIQLVTLDELPSSATNCGDESDVPYTYGTLAIGGGGFVSGIITSPTTQDIRYARTDVGGSYKWNAADCSWKPVTNFISEDDKGLLSIEALAIDPSNPKNIYMLGGSEYLSNQKTAIMYSKDAGETFTTVDVTGMIYVHGNGNGRGNGERIAVDPLNSNIIICGGRAGNPLIKSEDGGITWNVLNFPDVFTSSVKWPTWGSADVKTTANKNGISCVLFDKQLNDGTKTQRIYVGVSQTGTANIYMSEDGGKSWKAIPGLPTNWMPLRMKLDSNGRLLIAYADKEGPNNCGSQGGIYRYDPLLNTPENISPVGNYPIGDVSPSLDPQYPDRIVCTTICTWVEQNWGTGNGAVHGDIIFISEDAGRTWKSLQDQMIFDANGCTWIPDHAIHWSCSIEMDPFNTQKVSVTSGNGIFTTNNIWCDQPTFYFDVNGLEETVALDLVSVPGGYVYSVIGDYTGFVHKDIHAYAPIHKPESGTTTGIAYAAKNTDVMARVSKENIYYSEDAGESWTTIPTQEKTEGDERKIAVSADGKVLLFIGKHGCSYSTDKGANWTASTGISNPTYVIADPENENYIYAAGENTIYISADKGKTFTATALSNGGFSRIAVVPGVEGKIYAPRGSNGLAVSTDHGATFSPVPYVTTCDAVGIGIGTDPSDPAKAYTIYIWGKANGCDKGIYRSIDQGNTWERINDSKNQFGGPGNGMFIVGDMNEFGRFYLSTVGLGIVYGELTQQATFPTWTCNTDNQACDDTPVSNETIYTEENGTCYPNPFNETFTLHQTGKYTVVNAAGQLIESGTSAGKVLLGASWQTGTYFVTVDGKALKVIKQ